jgi:hypothetical protein
MNPRLRIAIEWLLVLPVLVVSMFAAMVTMEFSIVLDRPLIARVSALDFRLSPPLLLRPLHLLVMLGVALLFRSES